MTVVSYLLRSCLLVLQHFNCWYKDTGGGRPLENVDYSSILGAEWHSTAAGHTNTAALTDCFITSVWRSATTGQQAAPWRPQIHHMKIRKSTKYVLMFFDGVGKERFTQNEFPAHLMSFTCVFMCITSWKISAPSSFSWCIFVVVSFVPVVCCKV